MRKAPLPARRIRRKVNSNWPRAERCFWMKWASFHRPYRPSCFGSSRKKRSEEWEERDRSALIFGSSPQPIAILKLLPGRMSFARICITA